MSKMYFPECWGFVRGSQTPLHRATRLIKWRLGLTWIPWNVEFNCNDSIPSHSTNNFPPLKKDDGGEMITIHFSIVSVTSADTDLGCQEMPNIWYLCQLDKRIQQINKKEGSFKCNIFHLQVLVRLCQWQTLAFKSNLELKNATAVQSFTKVIHRSNLCRRKPKTT